MERGEREAVRRGLLLAGLACTLSACATLPAAPVPLDASSLPQIARVDERFQSYNIEMVEVTGGRFWAPYGGPEGEMFRMRPPADLGDPRLRTLAAHLAPAYVRVSGTWANSTYVPLAGENLTGVPEGFGQVLTRDQWRGLVEFSDALDAPIVTSFAASAGTRDTEGNWTPVQADRLLALTREFGGRLRAAEFINEPSLVNQGSLPAGYDADAFARDFATFRDWAHANAPDMLVFGPGNLGEATIAPEVAAQLLAPGQAMGTERLLARTAADIDAVSWHFYGGVSPRCQGGRGIDSREAALSDEWLDLTRVEWAYVAGLRDELAPGKPMWLTETAQAACGGSPWASTFRDTFRYLDQLGSLASRDVQVVMHNTLAASEYGLIDQDTLQPRPNYWGAVLWQRLMGPVVLDASGVGEGVRVYAHCLPQMDGGVGLLAINNGDAAMRLAVQGRGQSWLLQADDLDAGALTVNGVVPALADDGTITGLAGRDFVEQLDLPSQSIAFLALPRVANPACSGK